VPIIYKARSNNNAIRMSTTLLERVIHQHSPCVSPCRHHRQHNTFLHIAAIVRRGKVLAISHNKIGTRSKGSGYGNCTIHAEKAVVKRLGDIRLLKGATLCVWRVSTMGIMPSKPCKDCHIFLEKCMKEYGLRAVQYTDTIIPIEVPF
jgi:hypothetical protein